MASPPLRAAFPTGPLISDTSGQPTPAWRGFFMALYTRTGETSTSTAAFTSLRTAGAGGPTWTAGAGPPGAAVAPVGSLYSNTTGAVGATLYISRGGGVWNALAGV